MSRLSDRLPTITAAHRFANQLLHRPSLRGHLIAATVVYTTLWVGLLYGMECLFAAVPWVKLSQSAPTLFAALDLSLYVMDALLVLLLILPLTYGLARIFAAAAKGERMPLDTLFCAFESARLYRRALGRTLVVSLPRAAVLLAVVLLFSAANQADTTLTTLLLALAIAAVLLVSSFLLTLDAALGSLWQNDEPRPLYRSIALCRHRMVEIWLFRLSFFGWALLSLLSLGVVAIIHSLPMSALASLRFSHSLLPSVSATEENDIA